METAVKPEMKQYEQKSNLEAQGTQKLSTTRFDRKLLGESEFDAHTIDI